MEEHKIVINRGVNSDIEEISGGIIKSRKPIKIPNAYNKTHRSLRYW